MLYFKIETDTTNQRDTMPRKPRIEIPGYYHIVNRGVEQRTVFETPEDFEYFLGLLETYTRDFGIVLHNYCLMNNHYHLLVQNTQPNLSKFMRQLGMNYAIYFNKKHRRSGHLWQGRYKSWYVTDEAYLFTLMRYIEQNPVRAGLTKRVGEYAYASSYYFRSTEVPRLLQEAWIHRSYGEDQAAIAALLENSVDNDTLTELKKASALVAAPRGKNNPDTDALKRRFAKVKDIKERNQVILKSIEQGYSQHQIAKVLGITQPAVYGVIKRSKEKGKKQ